MPPPGRLPPARRSASSPITSPEATIRLSVTPAPPTRPCPGLRAPCSELQARKLRRTDSASARSASDHSASADSASGPLPTGMTPAVSHTRVRPLTLAPDTNTGMAPNTTRSNRATSHKPPPPELQGLHSKPKPKPTASPEPASTDEDEHAQSSGGAAPQAQTEPTSPVAPLAPYPPVPPGAGTRSRAPEFYGFVAWTGTYLLFCAYLLWAFLPDALIQALGVSWYPNRCVALPSSSPPSRALTSVSSRPSSLLRLPRLRVRYARPLDARAWPDRSPRPLISVRAPWPTRRASRVSPRATDRPRTARDGLSPSRNAQCPPPSLRPPAFCLSYFALRASPRVYASSRRPPIDEWCHARTHREWALLVPAYGMVLVLLTYFTYFALALAGTPAFSDPRTITGEL